MLPVNCNRMMTAGACPLTFWTVIIYKLKGYKVRGRPTHGPQAILRTSPPPLPATGAAGKLSPITLQPKKKKSLNGWFCIQLSLCWAYQCFFLDLFPYYSLCDICTLCYVDMCQCVYVCVCVRVFFSTACVSCFWLGAEPPPHDWLAAPCDVMVRSVLEWESRCAPLLVSVPVCVRWRLFLCRWSSFSCYPFLWNLSTVVFSIV